MDDRATSPATGRRAPVQGGEGYPAGTVAWEEHLRAWKAYRVKHRNRQNADQIAERDDLSYGEITDLLGHAPKTWEPR